MQSQPKAFEMRDEGNPNPALLWQLEAFEMLPKPALL
jgi:hypothetical protein